MGHDVSILKETGTLFLGHDVSVLKETGTLFLGHGASVHKETGTLFLANKQIVFFLTFASTPSFRFR